MGKVSLGKFVVVLVVEYHFTFGANVIAYSLTTILSFVDNTLINCAIKNVLWPFLTRNGFIRLRDDAK